MPFISIIRKIAGIFGHAHEVPKNNEMDELVDIVGDGFEKLNSRIYTQQQEIEQIRHHVLNKADIDHLNQKLMELQQEVASVIMPVHDVLEEYNQSLSQINKNLNAMGQNMRSLGTRVTNLESERVTKEDVRKIIGEEMEKRRYNVVTTKINNVTTAITDSDIEEEDVATDVEPVVTASTAIDNAHRLNKLEQRPIKPVKTVITGRNIDKVLPSRLISTFNELLNAEKFLTYVELSHRLGKKEATARAYVNDLRDRGVAVDEQTTHNGRKLVRLARMVRQEYIIPE